jgi:hypothetical protein
LLLNRMALELFSCHLGPKLDNGAIISFWHLTS